MEHSNVSLCMLAIYRADVEAKATKFGAVVIGMLKMCP